MQSVSSRIWTCDAISISYNDNHYTTGTTGNSFIVINRILVNFVSTNTTIVIFTNSLLYYIFYI